MIALTIILDGDNAWPDLRDRHLAQDPNLVHVLAGDAFKARYGDPR